MILPASSNQYWLPLFELLIEEDKACVKIVLSRASRNPASASVRMAKRMVVRNRGLFTCPGCHGKFKRAEAYRWYDNSHGSGYGYCSEDCQEKKYEDMGMSAICSVVKKHDKELENDGERIDIRKFLRVYIDCDGKKSRDKNA